MALDLNESDQYLDFNGRNTEQMPLLVADGRTPISVAGLMERRLHSGKDAWRDEYFDTGDALVYHPDKKLKV